MRYSQIRDRREKPAATSLSDDVRTPLEGGCEDGVHIFVRKRGFNAAKALAELKPAVRHVPIAALLKGGAPPLARGAGGAHDPVQAATAAPEPATEIICMPYPDPELCDCREMVEATRGRILIDVVEQGPIVYRAMAALAETTAEIIQDPWVIAHTLSALRCCPFDGRLMDPSVPERAREAVGKDGSPYCCEWLRDVHAAGKISLVDARRRDLAPLLKLAGKLFAAWHCSNCGSKLIQLNHERLTFFGYG